MENLASGIPEPFEEGKKSTAPISEEVLKKPLYLSYSPNTESSLEKPIKISVDFFLKPDKEIWEAKERVQLSLSNESWVVTRWIKKGTKVEKNKKVECRYSWSNQETKNKNNRKNSNIATGYLEAIKKLVNKNENDCDSKTSKGITNLLPKN